MSHSFFLLFLAIFCCQSPSSATSVENALRWSDAALSYLSSISCSDNAITTEDECHQLSLIKKSSMNVYLAEPTSEGRFLAVLPDVSLVLDGSHDGVLVLDPYPNATFGHLVIVFHLDLATDSSRCKTLSGKSIGNNECLSPVPNTKCQMMGKTAKVSFEKRCELKFLPLVYLQSETPHQSRQRLTCRDLPGFAKCPELRPKNEVEETVCDPLKTNTFRCSVSRNTVNTRCRMFETCDQAVMLSGGWNRQLGLPRYLEDLKRFYQMLKQNGFDNVNIKIFYANGVTQIKDEVVQTFPSSFKLALRYHLRNLCQNSQCVDSLVIYLSSPTKPDGTSLLWDADGNGQASENEQYAIKELMEDLENCTANQVSVVADQSYSGLLVDAFSKSRSHRSVQVFASGKETEYSWSSEYTKHWANFVQTDTCTGEVQKASEKAVRSSTPVSYDGSSGSIQRTIFGAPCKVLPPYTTGELRSRYYGCQNVPISVWASKNIERNSP